MSVIRVSKNCIDILVTAASWSDWRYEGPGDEPFYWEMPKEDGSVERRYLRSQKPDRVGAMLDWANNVAYGNRYNERAVKVPYVFKKVEGCNPKLVEPEQRPYLVASVMKEIQFYEYQTSEECGWEKTEPYVFCQALRQHVTSFLWTGVDSIPWGGDRAHYAALQAPRS
ncbi:hypothetical protein [Glycomyces sp. NPDC048151]|uniref:hypothetical protein n=1 Tax=Glycomyces sp. NPDC048151 TaxID=3364002 RepID=UPI00371A0388